MPTARGRSSSEKSTVSAERFITTMPAPAKPSTKRAAMKAPGFGAKAQAAEPAPKRARQNSKTFLRPKRSPKRPTGSIDAASTKRYPEENHCRSVSVACRAPASVGSATLRTVPSSPTASVARASAPSAHHFRVPLRAAIVAMGHTSFQYHQLFDSLYQKVATVKIKK